MNYFPLKHTATLNKYTVMRALGRPEWWLSVLLVWITLSALRLLGTPWQAAALTEWVRWASGIGLTLALGALLMHARAAAQLCVLAAGGLAVWGLAQAAGGASAASGPFGDHQLYGTALMILLPLTLALCVRGRLARERAAAQIVLLVLLAALAASETRSAWVGAASGGVVFGGLWLWTVRPPARALLLPALLGLGTLGAFAVLVTTTELQKPLVLRMQTLASFSADTSWQGRLLAWRGARQLVAQSPWTGSGLGQYPVQQRAWTHFGRPPAPRLRPSLSEQAHDFYLQTAAEIGFVGLALYGLALLAFAGRVYVLLRARRGDPARTHTTLAIATLAVIAAHLVDAVANPAWQFGEVSLLFWTILGVGLAAVNRPEESLAAFAPPRRALRFATAAALCIAVAAPALPSWGLLPPVEAYAGGTGLSLVSITLILANAHVSLRGLAATVPFAAIGHFRVTQSGEAAPDEPLTFSGPVADGLRGTQFVARGAFSGPAGWTGFDGDPAARNVLNIDVREGTPAGRAVVVQAHCLVRDDRNPRGRIVLSPPVTVLCYP